MCVRVIMGVVKTVSIGFSGLVFFHLLTHALFMALLFHLEWLMCVYSKCVSKWCMVWTCDNSLKWCWPTLVVASRAVLFADKCSVSLVKRTSTLCAWHKAHNSSTCHFMNSTTLQSHEWLEIKWCYFQVASVLFRFELQQVIFAVVYI